MKGFTLIEMVIVITITATLLLVSGIFLFKSLDRAHRMSVRTMVVSHIKQARDQSVSGKNDTSFGVRFFTNNIVLFQGASYAARVTANDVNYSFPVGITGSGITEVVFAKGTGVPSAVGSYSLYSLSGTTTPIVINTAGLVE